MNRTRLAVIILIIAVIIAIAFFITSPVTWGTSDSHPNKIVRWGSSGHVSAPSPVATAYSVRYSTAKHSSKISYYKSHKHVGPTYHPLSIPNVPYQDWCENTRSTTTGYNAIDRPILWGNLIVTFCWEDGSPKKWVDFRMTTSCDVNWWALWTCEGGNATSVDKSGGWSTKAPGYKYRYRRAHFYFFRGIQGFGQAVYPWAAGTYRTDGSYTLDHYKT